MIHAASAVAGYILWNEQQHHRSCSDIRLQMLLYFVQAKTLSETHAPCFADPMEAWRIGPVVPRVYRRYHYYAAYPILEPAKKPCLDDATQMRIESICDSAAVYSDNSLCTIAKSQDPWKKAANAQGRIIQDEDIARYFEKQKQLAGKENTL